MAFRHAGHEGRVLLCMLRSLMKVQLPLHFLKLTESAKFKKMPPWHTKSTFMVIYDYLDLP